MQRALRFLVVAAAGSMPLGAVNPFVSNPVLAMTPNRSLLRAQLAFAATWTAEWAFTVALAVVAFRDGGAAAVGLVGFARMAPAAVLSPIGAALGDRLRRDRVLVWSCVVRAGATGGVAVLLALDVSKIAVYVLAALATVGFTVFRPAHSALLPGLCSSPAELTRAIVVRGLLDSLSMLLGPLLAALLLGVSSPAAVFATSAALALGSAALLLRLSYESPPRGAVAPLRRIGHETLEGFRALARYRDARLLIALGLAQTLTRGFVTSSWSSSRSSCWAWATPASACSPPPSARALSPGRSRHHCSSQAGGSPR
ncbi:MAG: MFS transporter [Chloroflexota bacterium]|nr:MFS transporter [Chloroflexota bacterium]